VNTTRFRLSILLSSSTKDPVLNMPAFPSNPFKSSKSSPDAQLGERISAWYRSNVNRRPFLMFGLPFVSVMVVASFILTPATALRYERHDRKNRALTHSESLELGLRGGEDGAGGIKYNPRRRTLTGDSNEERDEYYRLMAKDLDNWEQVRVKRWKGEPDGRM
jgi:cytochrome c oxidase assembly protein subunit 16